MTLIKGGLKTGLSILARKMASIKNIGSQLKSVPQNGWKLCSCKIHKTRHMAGNNIHIRLHKKKYGLTIYPPSEYSLIGFFVAVWGVAS